MLYEMEVLEVLKMLFVWVLGVVSGALVTWFFTGGVD